MRMLVAVADYPNNAGNKAMMFVHTRNVYYKQYGLNVTVLNFSAEKDYMIDDIKVITLRTYNKQLQEYKCLIVHSANIRNHYFFLKKHNENFRRIIFFFHGHEIVKINEVYPRKYDYLKDSKLRIAFQNLYDIYKLHMWRKYYLSLMDKADYIFVSNSLFKEFLYYIRINKEGLDGHVHIINNGIGRPFEECTYDISSDKKYDFITIRSNMDSSVYCIDLLCRLAEALPNRKFLLIGKGQWFTYNRKPKNVHWIDETVTHKEIIGFINQAKAALMLTRRDAQGVMSCEMVTYGIPLITSNIPVCREMFSEFKNAALIDNNINANEFEQVYLKLIGEYEASENKKFYAENTIKKEIEIINNTEVL